MLPSLPNPLLLVEQAGEGCGPPLPDQLYPAGRLHQLPRSRNGARALCRWEWRSGVRHKARVDLHEPAAALERLAAIEAAADSDSSPQAAASEFQVKFLKLADVYAVRHITRAFS